MDASRQEGRRRRSLRLILRCVVFAAAVVLTLPLVPWAWAPLLLPALSPYVLIGSAIATRTIGLATWIGLPVLGIVLVRRRWFCRYVCPVGLMTEQAGRARRRGRSWARRLPPLGTWIVLATLAGACLGYPLLLWLDPLAIFHGAVGLWHDPVSLSGRLSAGALAIILVISLFLPGAWCLRICPLGATQDLLAAPQRWLPTWSHRRQAGLGGRGRAHTAGGRGRTKRAPGIGTLGAHRVLPQPPEIAKPESHETSSTPPSAAQRAMPSKRRSSRLLPRRSVLSAALGTLCAGLGIRGAMDASSRVVGGQRAPLRPPGAIDEPRFAGLCVRCGNCVRVCPTRIIHPAPLSHGVAGFLAPVLRFEKDYCRESCCRCTEVCPSGAIQRLWPEEKSKSAIGLAVLDPSICLLADDRECDICARVCPFEAVNIVWSEEQYLALPRVDAARCPGCGACEAACPGTNDWERQQADAPIPVRKAIEVHAKRRS